MNKHLHLSTIKEYCLLLFKQNQQFAFMYKWTHGHQTHDPIIRNSLAELTWPMNRGLGSCVEFLCHWVLVYGDLSLRHQHSYNLCSNVDLIV